MGASSVDSDLTTRAAALFVGFVVALSVATSSKAAETAKPKPTPAPVAKSTPKPKASSKPAARAVPVTVKSIEPTTVRAGETVTIVGTGLDQVAAVILGTITPEIVEQTAEKLVFRVLVDRKKPEGFRGEPYLVVPGRSVRSVSTSIEVLPATAPARSPVAPDRRGVTTVIEETVALAPGASKTLSFEFGEAIGLRVSVETGGSEVEASVAIERGGEPIYRLTYSGKLDWRVRRGALLGRAKDADGPRGGTVTLRNDAQEPVSVKLLVETSR